MRSRSHDEMSTSGSDSGAGTETRPYKGDEGEGYSKMKNENNKLARDLFEP